MPTRHAALNALAIHQSGVFSRAQARACGINRDQIRRRVNSKVWRVVAPRVFALALTPMTPMAWRWAALLSAGDRAVLSHATAAVLWAMPVPEDLQPGVHVTVPPHRRPDLGDGMRLHRHQIPPGDARLIDGLAVTSPERTVFDCAGTWPRIDARRLLDRAFQQKWATPDSLRVILGAQPNRPGNVQIARLLEGAQDAASQGERELATLLRDGKLVGWVANMPLYEQGRLVAVLDVAFPQHRLAIEVDGWAFHTTPDRFQRDRARQNWLVSHGWTVLRFTWEDLIERPGYVLTQIRLALAKASAV